jgi:phage anti-repressor protein
MREIIPIEQGKLGLEVNSRALHEKLGVITPHRKWIRRRTDTGCGKGNSDDGTYQNRESHPAPLNRS